MVAPVKLPAAPTTQLETRNADQHSSRFFVTTQIGFKVGTQGGGSIESDCEPDGPQIKAYDFSIAGGGSVEFGSFGAFARYDHGLVSIDNSDDAGKVYNRAIIVGVIWNTSNK